MLQKIREVICLGDKLDHFPKTDKEYERISALISSKSNRETDIHINTLKNLFDHWRKGTNKFSE